MYDDTETNDDLPLDPRIEYARDERNAYANATPKVADRRALLMLLAAYGVCAALIAIIFLLR